VIYLGKIDMKRVEGGGIVPWGGERGLVKTGECMRYERCWQVENRQ